MQYLFFIGVDPSFTPDPNAAPDPSKLAIEDWGDEVTAKGAWIAGDRLRPAEDATTVRVRGGELLVTDGPFVEGKEYIGGFDVIEAENLDEAIEIARKHPMAHDGLVEIRPIWSLGL